MHPGANCIKRKGRNVNDWVLDVGIKSACFVSQVRNFMVNFLNECNLTPLKLDVGLHLKNALKDCIISFKTVK